MLLLCSRRTAAHLLFAASCVLIIACDGDSDGDGDDTPGDETSSQDHPSDAATPEREPQVGQAALRHRFTPGDGGMLLEMVEGFVPRSWMDPPPPPRVFPDPPPVEEEEEVVEEEEEDAGASTPPPPPPPRDTGEDLDAGPRPLAGTTFANAIFVTYLADYRANTGETGEKHGPGGVFADLDGDDYPELVLVTAQSDSARLFRNVPHPVTGARIYEGEALPGIRGGGTGAVAADYDNDGDLDIFVANYNARDAFYRNRFIEDGVLSLEDVTLDTDPTPAEDGQEGLENGIHEGLKLQMTMTAAWADVNRDGFADLYVGTHNGFNGKPDVGSLPGQRDTLFLNNGDGTFTDVTMAAGVPGWENAAGQYQDANQKFASANAVTFMDMNGDAWPDLLVTNKTWTTFDAEMWYVNLGDDVDGNWLGFDTITYDMPAQFQNVAELAMGVAQGDIDNDGDLDLVVTDFEDPVVMRNMGLDAGIPQLERVDCCRAGYTWGAVFEDFDRDGLLDMHISSNSGVTDSYYRGPIGMTSNTAGGVGLAQRRQARSTMVADYDRDGWPDLFVVNLGGTSSLYRNQYGDNLSRPQDRAFLALRLEGDPTLPGDYRSTRDALGARVYVTANTAGVGPVTMRRDRQSGGSNAAASGSAWLRFGLGLASTADVTIQWPSGRITTLNGVAANQFLKVTETD